MTDPSIALKLFQEAFLAGVIPLRPGAFDKDLFVYADKLHGPWRFTYVRIQGRTVTELVMFAVAEPIDGITCFQVGYAVHEEFRREGRAKRTVAAAISELKNGLKRSGFPVFFVEAVIGIDNEASKAVAHATISVNPEEIIDELAGVPALRYVLKIGDDA